MGQKLHSDAEHGKRLRDFPNARKNGNRACSAWMENFFSIPFMKMSDLSLPRLTHSVLNLISSSLHGVTKSQEEGRKKVGSETLWQRKMKARWTESVLYFCMTTCVAYFSKPHQSEQICGKSRAMVYLILPVSLPHTHSIREEETGESEKGRQSRRLVLFGKDG